MLRHEEADKFQGVVEYNLVRGLMALVFIVVMVFLAPKASYLFGSLSNSLAAVAGDNSAQSYVAHSSQSNVFQITTTAHSNWIKTILSPLVVIRLAFGLFTSIGFIGLMWLAYQYYQRKKMLYEIE
jgi:hypothetical protein